MKVFFQYSSGILVFAILLFCNGCSERDDSYFPMTEGISWRYNIKMDTIDGPTIQKYFVSSIGQENLDGEDISVFQSLTGTQILYSVTDEGIQRLGYRVKDGQQVDKIDDNFLELPKQIEKGVVWESEETTELLAMKEPAERRNLELLATIPVKNEIVATDEVVKVIAGKFENCVHIKTTGSEFNSNNRYIGRTLVQIEIDRWYAPGIGLLKTERNETTTSAKLDKANRKMELTAISYQ